jgi:K+/H+ antiporter YhaU regulatory subunit KhtT
MVGKDLLQLKFRRRYNLNIIGLRREQQAFAVNR